MRSFVCRRILSHAWTAAAARVESPVQSRFLLCVIAWLAIRNPLTLLPSTLVDGRVSPLDDGRRNPESVQGLTAAWRRCPPGRLEPPRAPAQAATVDSPRGIVSRRGHHRR